MGGEMRTVDAKCRHRASRTMADQAGQWFRPKMPVVKVPALTIAA
jgi:hypothetical protein